MYRDLFANAQEVTRELVATGRNHQMPIPDKTPAGTKLAFGAKMPKPDPEPHPSRARLERKPLRPLPDGHDQDGSPFRVPKELQDHYQRVTFTADDERLALKQAHVPDFAPESERANLKAIAKHGAILSRAAIVLHRERELADHRAASVCPSCNKQYQGRRFNRPDMPGKYDWAPKMCQSCLDLVPWLENLLSAGREEVAYGVTRLDVIVKRLGIDELEADASPISPGWRALRRLFGLPIDGQRPEPRSAAQ